MSKAIALIGSYLAMVLLTLLVGLRIFVVRVREMNAQRVHPQTASTFLQMANKLKNVQVADNFKNLFEVPVLFYALCAVALAVSHVPAWLAFGAWLFVVLRVAHSISTAPTTRSCTDSRSSCSGSLFWLPYGLVYSSPLRALHFNLALSRINVIWTNKA